MSAQRTSQASQSLTCALSSPPTYCTGFCTRVSSGSSRGKTDSTGMVEHLESWGANRPSLTRGRGYELWRDRRCRGRRPFRLVLLDEPVIDSHVRRTTRGVSHGERG